MNTNDDVLNEMEVLKPSKKENWKEMTERMIKERDNRGVPFDMNGITYKVEVCNMTDRPTMMIDNGDEDWLCLHHTHNDLVECLKCDYPNLIGSDTFTIRDQLGNIMIEWACKECQADLEVYGNRVNRCEHTGCSDFASEYINWTWYCKGHYDSHNNDNLIRLRENT